jgi:hypothetical protein
MVSIMLLIGILFFSRSLNAALPEKYPGNDLQSSSSVNFDIGSDFRISFMGPDGNISYRASTPAVAYNSQNNEYLVVWSGSNFTFEKNEIWAQRVNAVNGQLLGNAIQISETGPDDHTDPDYDAVTPDVVYNSQENEYFIVWSADHNIDYKFEIFGRRIHAESGQFASTTETIASMGDIGPNYGAFSAQTPSVAYNSTENEYVVVWSGDTDAGLLIDNEFEIWAVRVTNLGVPFGSSVRISFMGGTGDNSLDATDPDVAYSPDHNTYLFVWEGDDDEYGSLVNNEYEIWARRYYWTLTPLSLDALPISDLGTQGDATRDALNPTVVYSSYHTEYLVAWEGNDFNNDNIYIQFLSETGAEKGSDDYKLQMGNAGYNYPFSARYPAVSFDPVLHDYVVVWEDDNLSNYEFEIWLHRIKTNLQIVTRKHRLSEMGPDLDNNYGAEMAAIACKSTVPSNYLVVWSGDDSTNGEYEIWGQLHSGMKRVFLPAALRLP